MLSLHYKPDRLRTTDNFIPSTQAWLAMRPHAQQIVAGRISNAAAWGARLLLEKDGRLVVWDGAETDITSAGHGLQGAPFQVLTGNAQREDRLFVADGLRPLWYLVRRGNAYVHEDVVNTVKDASGAPYPLPVATAITTWRNRLVIAYGGNRLRHCQQDDTAMWDPLWTIELQGARGDVVLALRATQSQLVAGLRTSVWGVTGTSQYNWDRAPILDGIGVAGPNAIASDGQQVILGTPLGVYTLGGETLSDDIRDAFAQPVYPVECVIDLRRRLLLVLAGGRLFVMHLDKAGQWGEIAVSAAGLFALADYTGWYGADGAWIFAGTGEADLALDGTRAPLTSRLDNWPVVKKLDQGGRALLERVTVLLRGTRASSVDYAVTADEATSFKSSATLTDTDPTRAEFSPFLPGTLFAESITGKGRVEVIQLNHRFRGDE